MKYATLLLTAFLLSNMVQAQPFQPYLERHKRLVQSFSLSNDGDTLYFSLPHKEYLEATGQLTDDSTPRLAMYFAVKGSQGWSDPLLLPISGVYKDYEPSLSPDGRMLFFNSSRPYNGKVPVKNNIWYSKKSNGTWGKPQYVKSVNTFELEESYPTITRSGELYFTAERIVDGESEYAIYHTKFSEKESFPIEKVSVIDIPQGTGDPWVAPDGSYLIFTKFGEDWVNTCDLFISFRVNESWSKPQQLTDLNSEGPDFAALVSSDGKWIYYRKNYQFIRAPFAPILDKLIN